MYCVLKTSWGVVTTNYACGKKWSTLCPFCPLWQRLFYSGVAFWSLLLRILSSLFHGGTTSPLQLASQAGQECVKSTAAPPAKTFLSKCLQDSLREGHGEMRAHITNPLQHPRCSQPFISFFYIMPGKIWHLQLGRLWSKF